MPKRKAAQEFEVHIEKDPRDQDVYRPAEWTKEDKNSYWQNFYWCRKQIIDAENEFVITRNPEYLRKAKIYNYYKELLVFEGRSLLTSKPPYKEVTPEEIKLTIWPPRPTRLDELLEECEKQDKEIEKIEKRNKELIKKKILKKRRISPPQSSDEIQIIESPKQTKHQKLKQSNKTPPEIGT